VAVHSCARVPGRNRKFYAGLIAELVESAEARFTLDTASGGTLRQRLQAREEMWGIRDPLLDVPSPPPGGEYLLAWFDELNRCRGSTGFGPSTINFSELQAWSNLKQIRLWRWEIDALMTLDRVWLRTWSEQNANKGDSKADNRDR
jgi:hypothetical protein